MIPDPTDPALLREHAFYDTGDLGTVLNIDTFTEKGGFKPILKYGLGYFNYGFGLQDEIYDRSILYMVKSHLHDHPNPYLFLILVFFAASIFTLLPVNGVLTGRKSRSKKNEDDVYYVKV
ncbi:LAMI_0F01948g1_1 [Lachancea mirantina]|uniref:LAMI_0F01948g1_1 n=1 Tax=Lachancea mirantina TaxID=1230905 RepID=A0A1G4JW55_9SACH|nr:LAMI_0F01948g1_1 [Lachancea mirantina]